MDVDAALVAHREAAVAGQPEGRALHDPAMPPQPLLGVDALAPGCGVWTRPGGSAECRREITLEAIGGETRMRLVQSRFPTAEVRDAFNKGWLASLGQLERVVNSRVSAIDA